MHLHLTKNSARCLRAVVPPAGAKEETVDSLARASWAKFERAVGRLAGAGEGTVHLLLAQTGRNLRVQLRLMLAQKMYRLRLVRARTRLGLSVQALAADSSTGEFGGCGTGISLASANLVAKVAG